MAISTGFLIKHIRPIGTGYDAYCSNGLIAYLNNTLQFSPTDITAIFAQWRKTAKSDPDTHSDLFVSAAKEVAFARWAELYLTSESSLMFLNQDQLVSLSLAAHAAGPNSRFTWNYGDDLAICVSINHDSGRYHIHWDAKGCKAATDAQRNVNHFYELI